MARVLVVEDERNIRTHLATYVRGLGHDVVTADGGVEALRLLAERSTDVVLTDVRMAGMDGLALLREIRHRHPDSLVVLMTAYATVPDAVEAIRNGAYDYLVKPFALDQVGLALARALEIGALRRENRSLRRAIDPPALLMSASPAMQQVLATAERVASSDATVLLTGESGTGKNVLAAAIHRWSERRSPFVTISCTTLAEHLLESELFGHVRGAFTGAWKDKPGRLEAADGGTVFLDEIGELSPELQAKLLRFLETHEFERVGGERTVTVDVRVVAATNRDLGVEVRAGHFRQDLFFRLNVIGLHLPPLRQRRGDIPALTEYLLQTLAARAGTPTPTLTEDARAALAAHSWPGNIRELANALERALVLARDAPIAREDLPDAVLAPAASPPGGGSLEDVERRRVEEVLRESATLEEAAARLGINVTTLWRKRRRWRLD